MLDCWGARSNVILKVDTIFDSMSNIMYSFICPIWQKPVYQGAGPKTPLPSKPDEPLRIRIPRFIICRNCEQEKILKADELTPIGWRCVECFKKYSYTFY